MPGSRQPWPRHDERPVDCSCHHNPAPASPHPRDCTRRAVFCQIPPPDFFRYIFSRRVSTALNDNPCRSASTRVNPGPFMTNDLSPLPGPAQARPCRSTPRRLPHTSSHRSWPRRLHPPVLSRPCPALAGQAAPTSQDSTATRQTQLDPRRLRFPYQLSPLPARPDCPHCTSLGLSTTTSQAVSQADPPPRRPRPHRHLSTEPNRPGQAGPDRHDHPALLQPGQTKPTNRTRPVPITP